MPVTSNNPISPATPVTGVTETPVQLPATQNSLLSCQAIVNALYSARLQLASQGTASITIDGEQTVFYRPADLEQSILFWERKVAVLSGKRRRVRTFWMR